MVPDALLLELHHHSHTTDTEQADHHQAQVAGKHVHCPVEDLFGAPYQGSLISFEATPPAAHTAAYTSNYQISRHKHTVAYTCLRGPPLA
nr:hypothetical protein [Pontibacter sp. 172403-2]